MDSAYDIFAAYLFERAAEIVHQDGVDFNDIFGHEWRAAQADVARYYAKHFGCRLVADGLPVPKAIRNFLNGGPLQEPVHLALCVNMELVNHPAGKDGLSLSPTGVHCDRALTRVRDVVMANYVACVGVRYEWRDDWGATYPGSFVGHPNPILNRFVNTQAVLEGRAGIRKPLSVRSSRPRMVRLKWWR